MKINAAGKGLRYDDDREVCPGDVVRVERFWLALQFRGGLGRIEHIAADEPRPGVQVRLLQGGAPLRFQVEPGTGRLPSRLRLFDRDSAATGDAFSGTPERRQANAFWHEPAHWEDYWARVLTGDAMRLGWMVRRDATFLVQMLQQAGCLERSRPPRRLLEAGCGLSLEPPFFAALGLEVTALDLAGSAVAAASARAPSADDLADCLRWDVENPDGYSFRQAKREVRRARFESLRRPGGSCRYLQGDWFDRALLAPGSFDLILSSHTLRFSTREVWCRTLERFAELLRPDGVLVLQNMNVIELWEVTPPLAEAAGFVLRRDGAPAVPGRKTAYLRWSTG